MIFQSIVLSFFASLIICVILTPFVIRLMKKFRVVDDPFTHIHPAIIHDKPIPRGGSITLFFAVFFTSLIFLPINPTTIGIFFASFLALLVGIYDDVLNSKGKDLSPYIRFGMNIVCAVIVVLSGVSISFITNPFGGIINLDIPILSLPFFTFTVSQFIAIGWIVWIMNMLNWSKGVDGQMPGIVAIASIVIGTLSLRGSGIDIALLDAKLSFILAGAAVGFLFFNFYPAKIFPGYGATSIYLLLAVVSILSSAKLATAILVLGVPTVDALFTIFRRILSGKSPFWHDKKHLHHILLRFGLSQRQIALSYWLFSVILGSISLTLESRSKLFAMIMVISVTGGALLFLHLFMHNSHEEKTI